VRRKVLVLWILAAAAVLALVLAFRWAARRVRALQVAEAQRRRQEAAYQDQRERAQRVLAGQAPPLERVPVVLPAGESAYHLVDAAALSADGDGFRREVRGRLLVTDRAVYFVTGGEVRDRYPVHAIERVEVPFANVAALVSFGDGLHREERRAWFEVAEPLVLAAHISRFAGFELILS